MKKSNALSIETRIVNELGMHARPAAKIAEMAMEARGSIWLNDGVSKVDASSIIDILTLCAIKGSHIQIQIECADDREILEELKLFFDSGFGE